ncbi:MAG TPA: NAD-dependent DNA ligase LigA [Candidatus Saccharimonadales bacterium]|nr:NAD-dependent DNA ligase LigA [Candidatus Saccharimonadales bacterium]
MPLPEKDQAAERIAKLREQINDYRYYYHVLDKSTMSEAAADSLKHELSQLEDQFPDLITPDSPTQRVAGKPSSKFAAVAHTAPMLSLQDVFDEAEARAWVDRIKKLQPGLDEEFYVEIKMDGLAAAVIYEDGLLVRALTRGDGRTGEDVTANIRTIDQVPLVLRRDPGVPDVVYRGRFEVRGEVMMYKAVFGRLNAEREEAGQPLFANPRNTAAGTIRQLDPALVAARPLSFHVYALATNVPGLDTHGAQHELAAKLGFKVEPHSEVVEGVEGIMKFAHKWEDKRHDLPYGTDGLVATINDTAIYNALGVVGKAPRGSVAYKFPAEQATTILKEIMVSIGRTGAATPFAVLEAVKIAGSTVKMATLHNAGEVARKDIRIGDTVIVQKAGDIIPEVVAPLPKLRTGKEKPFVMPKNCPVCGQPLGKGSEEAVWRCVNFDCPALKWGRVVHFASKDAYDIEGMGEKNVEALIDAELVEDAADLFSLTYDQLVKLERFADISARKLVDSIQDRKNISFDRFIYALGIRHVGQQTAIDLADHFGSLNRFRQVSLDELQDVAGIGKVVAGSVYEWLNSKRHQNYLEKLTAVGVRPVERKRVEGRLTGQSFVITGTLDAFSREAASEKIVALGGKLQNSVTKDTTYLIIGDSPGGSKVKQAEKHGTKQIDETGLLKLLK